MEDTQPKKDDVDRISTSVYEKDLLIIAVLLDWSVDPWRDIARFQSTQCYDSKWKESITNWKNSFGTQGGKEVLLGIRFCSVYETLEIEYPYAYGILIRFCKKTDVTVADYFVITRDFTPVRLYASKARRMTPVRGLEEKGINLLFVHEKKLGNGLSTLSEMTSGVMGQA
ncbi:hypothetical protein Tco_0961395 [Tanacetum coccineum]